VAPGARRDPTMTQATLSGTTPDTTDDDAPSSTDDCGSVHVRDAEGDHDCVLNGANVSAASSRSTGTVTVVTTFGPARGFAQSVTSVEVAGDE